jgi:hypothetical protein
VASSLPTFWRSGPGTATFVHLWRHWRTMAFLASCSAGVRKTDGLLARAGELWGILRASYLSPFFPLVLGFELWRYFRPQLQTGDRSVPTRCNRSSLRLLRGAAFGVTLMLPAKGWAQGDGTPASAQTPAKTSETSADVLKREERQRILGVVPNVNTVESSDGVPSLSARTEVPLDASVQEAPRGAVGKSKTQRIAGRG